MIVPVTSMAHSAYGALAADVQHSSERSLLMRGGGGPLPLWHGLDAEAIEDAFVQLEADCFDAMDRARVDRRDVEVARTVDMRYRRQTNDLVVSLPERPLTVQALQALVGRFEEAYEQIYGKGSAFREAGIELTNVRVEAFGRSRRPEIDIKSQGTSPTLGSRAIFEPTSNTWMQAKVHHWRELSQDAIIQGPAVIEHPETSVFIAAGQIAKVDEGRNVTIEHEGRE